MQWESEMFASTGARQPPELRHYGIKGQRWGQRRFQEEDGTYTAAGKERYGRVSGKASGKKMKGADNDKEEAKKRQNGKKRSEWKAKDVSELSDEELRRRNNRLQAEQNYKNSMTPEWKKTARQWGKEALKAVLVTAATTLIAEAFKEQLKPVVKDKIKDIFNKASKKKISTLKTAKRKTASFLASMMMRKELNKDKQKKG